MIRRYIRAAMRQAKYEVLGDDDSFYGEIPPCRGVYANADTLEACRDQLEEVLEAWILLGLRMSHTLPVIDGIDLNAAAQKEAI